MSFNFGNQLNVTAQINAVGLAKDTSVQAVRTTLGTPAQDGTVAGVTTAVSGVNTTLGTPAQDSSVHAVTTALGTPAQTSDINAVRTTLGTPAQTSDVITTLPTNLGGGKKLSDINTTLGTPAQTSDIGALHTSGKTVAGELAVTSLTGTGLVKESGGILSTGIALPSGAARDTSLSTINTTLGTPAQHADVITTLPANIATSGVPLLALSTLWANPGNQTFTAGQTRTLTTILMNQPSYEISVYLQAASSGETTPFMEVTLTWTDVTTSQTVAREKWVLGACTGPTNQNFYSGVGRCKGSALTVTWKWLGAATSGTCSIVVTTTSRIYLRDDFRSVNTFNGMANFTSGVYDLDGGCVINTNPTIGGNSSATRALPLYHGTVQLAAQPPEAFTVSIQNAAESTDNGGFPASEIWQGSAAGGGVINSAFPLPRSNCTITLSNTSATSATFPLQMLISEQEM